MGWATPYIAKLKNGEMVQFRPRGNSMQGKIDSGQLCTVEPISDFESLKKGDIVLCKVNGNEYLHLIKAI
jgi:exosome complex RNA-binding protein Csl4